MQPGGDLAEHKHPDPELRRPWKQDAWQGLRRVIGTAFGGFPRGVRPGPWCAVRPGRPRLASLADHGLRGWAIRHRGLDPATPAAP